MYVTTEPVDLGSVRLGVRETAAADGRAGSAADGVPVVALPGLASSARTWDALAIGLAGHRIHRARPAEFAAAVVPFLS